MQGRNSCAPSHPIFVHLETNLFDNHVEKNSLFFSGKESTFYELDDVRHVAKKDPSDKNISMSEAMTQTDWQMFDRMGGFSDDLAANPPGSGQATGLVATGDYYRSVHVLIRTILAIKFTR